MTFPSNHHVHAHDQHAERSRDMAPCALPAPSHTRRELGATQRCGGRSGDRADPLSHTNAMGLRPPQCSAEGARALAARVVRDDQGHFPPLASKA